MSTLPPPSTATRRVPIVAPTLALALGLALHSSPTPPPPSPLPTAHIAKPPAKRNPARDSQGRAPLPPGAGSPAFARSLRAVFGASYFDVARDHNCDLDTVALLRHRKSLDSQPLVLVHIDYHADIMRNNEHITIRHEGIGNYINRLMSDGTVREVYWVLPDSSASASQRRLFWDTSRADDVYFNDGPRDQTLYVRPGDHQLLFARPRHTDGLRAIAVHKRLLKDLPSFAAHRSDLWIDIDADFFSNTGIWTRGKASLRFTPRELERQLEAFVRLLERKGAHPVLTTGSLSPGFTHRGDLPAMQRFFYRIGLVSCQGAALTFHHRRSDRGDGEWGNRLHGRVVPLDERREYQAVYRLEALESTEGTGSGHLPLAASAPLYRSAVAIVQGIWQTTTLKARGILVSMSQIAGVPGVRVDLGKLRRHYEAGCSKPPSPRPMEAVRIRPRG